MSPRPTKAPAVPSDWGKRLDLGEGIRYSSNGFEQMGGEASWLTIGTIIDDALSPNYNARFEIEILTVFGVRGASASGHDVVARGHVYLEHFPSWKDALREGNLPNHGQPSDSQVHSSHNGIHLNQQSDDLHDETEKHLY